MSTDQKEEESKPGRGNSKCKGPEVEVRSEPLKHRMEARVVQQSEAGAEQSTEDEGRATLSRTIFTIVSLRIKSNSMYMDVPNT